MATRNKKVLLKPEVINGIRFTAPEMLAAIKFLEKVRKAKGFWPNAVWPVAYAADSRWAAELVMVAKGEKNTPHILLAVYQDGIEEFRGQWHIPGGHGKIGFSKFSFICDLIASREIGRKVKALGTIGLPYLWREGEHPRGQPLSIFIRCEPERSIDNNEHLRWFPLTQLPDEMVEVHRRFIEENLVEIISA